MLKPLLAAALVNTVLALYLVGQASGKEDGMAYAREEAVHYKNAISLRDQQLYDLQISAIYWKRTTEKLLSGPGVSVFDCLAVDTN